MILHRMMLRLWL